MKRVDIILAAVLLPAMVWSQSPEKMSYQAVVRDANNELVSNKSVGMQISILQGSVNGVSVYIETQTPGANSNGLVTLEIGAGTVVNGNFSAIDWTEGPYFIQNETDPAGGTNYTISGISQLLSVPYALHAKTAETITSGITENDPVFGASPAVNITETDIIRLGNLSGINTGDQDLSALAFKTALGDSINLVRSEIPDVSDFLTTEKQTLSDVAKLNNAVNTQLKNVSNPTDAQDAATKSYVDVLKAQIAELQLLTGIKIKDIEGNIYNTVTIGTQVWMAENLKTTRYNDGTAIPLVTDNTEWSKLSTPAYCWYRADKANFADIYGALYNWYAVETGNLCPDGWHVPTDKEWQTLSSYIGDDEFTGGKLKETGTTHWITPNTGATNETGFTALPGGNRDAVGEFSYLGYIGYWWSSTAVGNTFGWPRFISYDKGTLDKFPSDRKKGFSVRCVKN